MKSSRQDIIKARLNDKHARLTELEHARLDFAISPEDHKREFNKLIGEIDKLRGMLAK